MKIDPLVLQPHQARWREPSAHDNQLADAMEKAFGQGLWDIDQLVDSLNQAGVHTPQGQAWTADALQSHLHTASKG